MPDRRTQSRIAGPASPSVRILAAVLLIGTATPFAGVPSQATDIPPELPRAGSSHPDISHLETADRIGNVLFWVGQAKLLAFAGGPSTGATAVFTALYAAQQAGLGLNYYANHGYFRTYDAMGAESSFLRRGARTLYIADKALTAASMGLIAYGVARDRTSPALAGALAFGFTNLLDFYVWHQLRQSNGEARSGVLNWNAGVGLLEDGMHAKVTFSFNRG